MHLGLEVSAALCCLAFISSFLSFLFFLLFVDALLLHTRGLNKGGTLEHFTLHAQGAAYKPHAGATTQDVQRDAYSHHAA